MLRSLKSIFVAASIFAVCTLASCGRQAELPPTEEPAPVPEQKVVEVAHPDHPGVFFQHDGMFIEMQRGTENELMTTNAERGFGFSQPQGDHYSVPLKSWTVWSKRMNLTTLQITRIEGTVIMPQVWFDAVSNENIAWLPSSSVKLKVSVPNKTEPLAVISVDEPLAPGFYVLHDDSFVRARQTDEVTSYYPFIITDDQNQLAWEVEAQRCFESFFAQYELAKFGQTAKDFKKLRQCAELHQLSYKLVESEKNHTKIKDQLLFLASIAREASSEVRAQLYNRMDVKGSELTSWFWQRIHAEVMHRLTEIAHRVRENVPYDDQVRALYEFYLGTATPNDTGLKTLYWVPFAVLDPQDEQLQTLFEDINNDALWAPQLIDLLGAIEYNKIERIAQKNPVIDSWFESFKKDIDPRFTEKLESLKFRDQSASIAFGPMWFSGVLESERTMLTEKVNSKLKEISSCYNSLEKRKGRRDALLVFDISLDNHLTGRGVPMTLRDPFGDERKAPVYDNDFSQCLRKAFSDVSLPATLDPSKFLSFTIVIHGKNKSAALID